MDVLSYPVVINPEPAALRWHALRRAAISRGIGLGISVLIWAAIWFFSQPNLWDGFFIVLGISLGLSLVLWVWSLVRSVRAKRDVRALHEGLAIGLGRDGIFLDGPVPWEAILAFLVKPARGGRSATLVVVAKSGAWRTVPLQWLDQSPASLDNAVRALSGNRLAIDLDPIDHHIPVAQVWERTARDRVAEMA